MARKRGLWQFCAMGAAVLAGLGSNLSSAQEVEATEPRPLLTGAMESAGINQPLKDAGITVGGYAQASWTYNTSSPHTQTITGRGFDFENQDLTLNGLQLTLERAIEASKDKFDIGFRVDVFYGADARFMHSNGLLDNKGFVFDAAEDGDTGPNEQFDLPQAFVQFGVPVGRGLLVTVGKFITPIGYEYVDPTKNTLYSHSYLFNFGAPFSHLGVTGKYSLSDELTVVAGLTRGWDQSIDDINDDIDFLGQINYKIDSQWDTFLTLSTGPQTEGSNGWRTLLDALVYYVPNETWSFGFEGLYGVEAGVPGTGDDYSQFYGVAVYPSYKIAPGLSVNGRAEWFSDVDGIRGVGSNNVYEATIGLTWAPFANVNETIGEAFKIRPEIRFDYADDPVFDGSRSQTTFAVDAVLAF